jgi:ATPase subunit of ABC transporter with duplicated ATPase domains
VGQFQLIKDSFEKTHKDLENLLQLVKAQVRSQAMGIQSVLITDTDNTVRKLLMLPPTKTDQHYDRDNVFKDLDNKLAVQDRVPSFLSVALFGLSGVGKSTVVSTYAEARFREKFYDVILWARGENSVSLRQSFTEIALRLRLSGAQHHSHDQNLILVQDWFQSTRKFGLGK